MSISETELLIMNTETRTNDNNEERRYGWEHCTPGWLQFMNKPKWALVVISALCMNQGIVVNGLLHLFVPHIERRFEMSSTELSVIINAYDIGSLILLMPITYLGSRPAAHRPRIIGQGSIIVGTGSLVFSVPAFITGPYYGEVITNLCQDRRPIVDKEPIPHQLMVQCLLFFGNFLHGVGAVPLSTLSLTYLDDSVPAAKSSLFIGVFYGMAIVGPAIGIGVGGIFSRYLDVDFLRHLSIPEDELLTPDNPRWVGCWWIGFVIFGILFYPLGILILGFPRMLKGTKELVELKKIKSRDDCMTGASLQVPEIRSFRSLPSLLWFVVSNPRFDLVTLAGCCELLLLTGLGTHFPKLLEQQFNLDPLMVSICYGAITVPPCLIGICLGALIMRMYQPELKSIFLLCTLLMSICSMIILGLILHCPDHDFSNVKQSGKLPNLQSPTSTLEKNCNKNCHCDETLFTPVCGVDNQTYFSPCFAGCETEQSVDNVKFYLDCRCINSTLNSTQNYQAKQGACPKACNILYLSLVGVFIYQVTTFTAGVPAITASLRCNDVSLRSLALAVQWMSARLLGAIPGPVILGSVIDSSCIYWSYVKGVRGNCLVYDHWRLGWLTTVTCVSVKLFQVFAFFGAYVLEVRRLKTLARSGVVTSSLPGPNSQESSKSKTVEDFTTLSPILNFQESAKDKNPGPRN